jgi:polygalacturonase
MAAFRWIGVVGIVACVLGPFACGSPSGPDTGEPGSGSSSSSGSGGVSSSSSSSGSSSSGSASSSSGSGGVSSSSSGSGSSSSGGGPRDAGNGSDASIAGKDAGSGSSSSSSSSSSGGSSSSSSSSGGGAGLCAGDTTLPPQPVIPPACTALTAALAVASGGVPSETNMDTARIQSALTGCASGHAVRLTTSGANNAFITGPITIPSGVTLWVDTGTTLYGTRNPSVYGSAAGLINTFKGGNLQGIVGAGTIDGQGGEPMIGASGSFWDQNGNGGSSPSLIVVNASTNFTLYGITLHNSPMFHVKLDAAGFMVWGVTIKTPSKATNSAGTALTPTSAHNTDGIDPGEAASNGYIVCTNISDGDDQIAIKGGTNVNHLTIAHDHFLAGHGMSIGSEATNVSNINVYDLSIDGTTSGFGGGSSNGIRIKADPSTGGSPGVSNVTYSDVCVRDLANPILLTPRYTNATGTKIPMYTGITIRNFRDMTVAGALLPTVTIDGFDTSHITGITLDNVILDQTTHVVTAADANVTLGPGNVNFTVSGTNVTVTNDVSGTSTPNPCTNKFITF